jgi:hypothetical protein
MTRDEPTRRLAADEIAVLTFAARRQLTRWANRGALQPRARAQRTALVHAVRVLDDRAFTHGCELRATRDDG